jgi:hypothetical protein
MKIEGSRPELDGVTLKKNTQPIDFMPNKFGLKVRPYEITLKMK